MFTQNGISEKWNLDCKVQLRADGHYFATQKYRSVQG